MQASWLVAQGYSIMARNYSNVIDLLRLSAVAEDHKNRRLLKTCWQRWQSSYEQARQLEQFALLVKRRGELARCRRTFAAWTVCKPVMVNWSAHLKEVVVATL